MEKLNTILLIDDDEICSWLNKLLLEEMEAAQQVVCFYEGQEALAYLKGVCSPQIAAENPPDLIFLDLDMQGMDGYQVLDGLKEVPGGETLSRERIIILTTSMHPADLEKASSYNILSYLVKPLTETKVKALIEHCLHARRQGQSPRSVPMPPPADRDPKQGQGRLQPAKDKTSS